MAAGPDNQPDPIRYLDLNETATAGYYAPYFDSDIRR